MTYVPATAALAALSMLTALSSVSHAGEAPGVHAVIDHSRGAQVDVSYRDNANIRIGTTEEALYYLTSEGKPYVVMANHSGSKRFAMNMVEFLTNNGQQGGVTVPGEPDLDGVTARPLERTETVAGIEGTVISVEDGNLSWELVVTDDPRVTGMTRAIYSAEIRMAHMANQPMGAAPLARELKIAEATGKGGILRGQLYTVSAFESGQPLADDHFQLAADVLVVKSWQEMMDSYH